MVTQYVNTFLVPLNKAMLGHNIVFLFFFEVEMMWVGENHKICLFSKMTSCKVFRCPKRPYNVQYK